MRTLQTPNRIKNGLAGIVIIVLVVTVGQSFSGIPQLFAQPTYYGQFTDTAGLNAGDKVRIAGMDVGEVKSLKIDGNHVLIGFNLGARQIGTESRVAIRTETILGKRVLEIEPRGSKMLQASAVLPTGQTTTPYQIYDAVFDVTTAARDWDIDTVKQSLNVLSETIDQTYPHLSAALDGVARFSDTIGKRDEQFKQLLANANKVAAVLGNRSEQINRLAVNAQTLLAAVNERRNEIDYLLANVSLISQQFTGFINDNPNLNHVLEQLKTISDVLVKHKTDLSDVLITASKFMGALAEAIGSGPYFKVLVVNLVPYQILQPWVDAAFKKRGIDPEEFWRNAGLPAFRFPDPNGQRQPNGAPPPAPIPLEGTPDHPGPAVGPGSPCSYTPPPDGIPTTGNPLPCAGLTNLPFGPVAEGAYPPPDVPISAPNPAAGYSPGVPSAAFPGELSPSIQGVPAPPLAPGPPGARTVPVGPLPGPATDIPGYAPPPNALIGPIPPAGPGPQVPPVGDLAPVDQGGGA
jgi:phospholipid/cholesterol/gamma-HCH transport system substrate-binding protein